MIEVICEHAFSHYPDDGRPQMKTQEVVHMKRSVHLGLLLAVCVVLAAWPSLASAQKSEEPAQKSAVTGQEGKAQTKEPDQSKGKWNEYKKELEKELRALDKKVAVLGKKVKKQGSKLEVEAKESWNDLKVKQKAARDKLKRLSSAGDKAWKRRSLRPRLPGMS
jgi:hypothetical protein